MVENGCVYFTVKIATVISRSRLYARNTVQDTFSLFAKLLFQDHCFKSYEFSFPLKATFLQVFFCFINYFATKKFGNRNEVRYLSCNLKEIYISHDAFKEDLDSRN